MAIGVSLAPCQRYKTGSLYQGDTGSIENLGVSSVMAGTEVGPHPHQHDKGRGDAIRHVTMICHFSLLTVRR